MTLNRVAARAAAFLVAAVAGAASFEHIASVAMAAGESTWVAYSLPLAIDGLILVGVAALLEDKAEGRHSRWSARLAVVTGVAATLAANVASAAPDTTARLVAVTPPVAFMLAVEVLTRTGRRKGVGRGDTLTTNEPVGGAPSVTTEPTTGVANRDAPKMPPDQGKHSPLSGSQSAQNRPTRTRAPRKTVPAAERVARAHDKTPDATHADMAARLRLSVRTVQRHRAPLLAVDVSDSGATAVTTDPTALNGHPEVSDGA